jgi:transposase-like protein
VTTYGTDLDFGGALAAPSRCPSCGSHDLRAACHDDQAVFLCSSCGQGWQIEMGRVTRAEPDTGPAVAAPK